MAKLTESHLRKIIKEELRKVLQLSEEITDPKSQMMSGDEIKKVFDDAIKSGNSAGVKEYLSEVPEGTTQFMVLNNVFGNNVIVVPLNAYSNIAKLRSPEAGNQRLSEEDYFERLSRSAYIKLPYESANILKKYGLKIF